MKLLGLSSDCFSTTFVGEVHQGVVLYQTSRDFPSVESFNSDSSTEVPVTSRTSKRFENSDVLSLLPSPFPLPV